MIVVTRNAPPYQLTLAIRMPERLLSLTLFLAALGCGGQRGPDYSVLKLAQVHGAITMDGEPLSGARVEFVEAEAQPPRLCFGTTDESGHYEIRRDLKVPGCLPGEMIVRIKSGPRGEGEEGPVKDAKIPARYNSKSELRVTVEPNGSQTFDFDLKSN